MKKRTAAITLLLLLCFTLLTHPSDDSAFSDQEDQNKQYIAGSAANTNSLLVFPVVYYTPETKIAGGILGGYYFYPSENPDYSKPSSITLSVIYTELDQITSEITWDIFCGDYRNRITGAVGYSKFPSKFWGIGNDTPYDNEEDYTPEGYWFNLSYKYLITKGLFTGLDYEFLRRDITVNETSGGLKWESVPGRNGGIVSRFGISVVSDTRDHLFCPSSGAYYQAQVKFASRIFGSEFDFTSVNMDMRLYKKFLKEIVIAAQLNGVFNMGDTPFFSDAYMGGKYLMRGFYEGRYRDDNMLMLQTECRMPLFWRFGAVAFAGIAQVAPRIGDFTMDGFKFAFGSGIRFLWDKEQKLNIRFDLGFAEGDIGLYITIGEVF